MLKVALVVIVVHSVYRVVTSKICGAASTNHPSNDVVGEINLPSVLILPLIFACN